MSDMVIKEKVLLRLVRNITAELKARGKDAILNDELSYYRVFPDPDIVIKEYSKELDRLLKVAAETEDMERFFEQYPDSPWQEALLSLRRQVLSNFEEDGELKARGKDAILNDKLSYSLSISDKAMIKEYSS